MSKKLMLLFAIVTLAIFAMSFASARTVVSGKIYNSDFSSTIAGANVTVTCNSFTNSTVSMSGANDGMYAVSFDTANCNENATVMVNASSGDLHGSAGGTIINGAFLGLDCGLDFTVVNVPLVPEFGLIAGTSAIALSLAALYFIRRRN